MAPLPKNSIDHFTHAHPLTATADDDREFLCDGCKTLGIGKRYRCHGCDFDMHDYCGTCPRTLSAASMHRHALTLVMRKAAAQTRQVDRICDVCTEPVEGLFYRCKECEFDVHPLCTQLPEKLNHALHKIHPLTLQSSPNAGFCTVCRLACGGWRYRCGVCRFDIHLECVLEPVVPYEQSGQRGIPTFDQGIPYQPPPQFAPFYGYPCGPGYPNFGPGYNMYYGGPFMYPPGNYGAQPANFQVGASNNNQSRVGKSMFGLVKRIGFGVVSNMIFGVDVTGLFTGN